MLDLLYHPKAVPFIPINIYVELIEQRLDVWNYLDEADPLVT